VPQPTAGLAATEPPPAQETPAPGGGNLANTKWVLINITQDGSVQSTFPGTQVTLDFGADGTFSGNGGCNSFGGQYTAQGEILTMTNIFATERACLEPEKNQLESAYLAALDAAQLFEIRDDALTITFNNGAGKLTFSKQV
jgi:heat shock protein HslJ